MVRELDRYGVIVAALQESKWMGSNMYQVDESVVFATGQQVLGPGEPLHRGEDVALVLNGPAMGAWQEEGKLWKAWSSRLISIQLQIGKEKSNKFHVMSCCAPTRAASRAQKDQFYDDLQQALTAMPSDEIYVLLGDFNARVGSRLGNNDPWSLVRGSHGYGECNDAGKELLGFLSSNEAVVCNTLFMNRNIQKQTWQHPKSKQWHCIDFAITGQKDCQRCLNATVMRVQNVILTTSCFECV